MFAPGPRAWRRVMLVAAWAALPIMGVIFTLEVQDRGEREDEQIRREFYQALCEAIVPLDDAYRATPPTTPLGKTLAVAYGNLRRTLECDRRT